MFTKKLIINVLLVTSSFAFADQQTGGQFAVLKPELACEVKIPQGRTSSQVYFSHDCKTAYVLPSLNMKKTIMNPYLTADHKICDRFEQVLNRTEGYDAKISKLDNELSRLQDLLAQASDEEVITKLERQITLLSKMKKDWSDEKTKALEPFFKTRALRTQITAISDQMDEVAAFQTANIDAISTDGKIIPTRFVPAHITNSILAISKVDTSDETVLNVDFPGKKYIPTEDEKSIYSTGTTFLEMNGALSGIVDLSAVTYCTSLKLLGKSASSDSSDLKEVFHKAVAINNDYNVRVQSGVKLHMISRIKTLDFLSELKNEIRNSEFRRDEFVGVLMSGKLANMLEISIDDKGSNIDLKELLLKSDSEVEEEGMTTIGMLFGKFVQQHLDTIESKLTKLGLLEKVNEARAKEIQAGTRTEVAGYREVCTSSSSFFGLKKSSHCSTHPVYVTVKVDGISKLLKENSDNTEMLSEMLIQTNQTLSVKHTSTFGKF